MPRSPRSRRHLVVRPPEENVTYKYPGRGGGERGRWTFRGSRRPHAASLRQQYREAIAVEKQDDRDSRTITVTTFPGALDILAQLESRKMRGPRTELLSATIVGDKGDAVITASVYIPESQESWFLQKLDEYVATVDEDRPRHQRLIESIAQIRRATARLLWTDPPESFPDDGTPVWWEVWLREDSGTELDHLLRVARSRGLSCPPEQSLRFDDRTVCLLRGAVEDMVQVVEHTDGVAELRRPHQPGFFTGMRRSEQIEWIEDLLSRGGPIPDDAPAVCVLDTGVQREHRLLTEALNSADCHRVDAQWRPDPVYPHGTEMAGLALYGDLEGALSAAGSIRLDHRLESVKILPDQGRNEPRLYAAVTSTAVDRPEVQAPGRSRIFLMAVTAPGRGDEAVAAGMPTSWAAAVDALSYGRSVLPIDQGRYGLLLDREEPPRPRLFIISAGNIRDPRAEDDYLARCDVEPIEDPAQAWNALTVGAYSASDDMESAPASFVGYGPIAPAGDLAPTSRTSVSFAHTDWPFKPDVVADGGNLLRSPDGGTVDRSDHLSVLTTRFQPFGTGSFLTGGFDTSAAAAQVAAIAASVQAAYPALRPETVRGLVVHSARWTDAMRAHQSSRKNPPKGELQVLRRRYGMGVPDLGRALRSASDALTLMCEGELHPFKPGHQPNADHVYHEMALHELPWPRGVLDGLGEAQAELRVTLSYFIEPNPSRRGWKNRYAYQSYGLRFSVKRSEETNTAFSCRINSALRGEDYRRVALKTEEGWVFGADSQAKPGSLHTDIWRGTAADLAGKGVIAVHPVSGWWKSRPSLDRSGLGVRYSLIVSIETPESDVDIYTPVSTMIAAAVEVEM